MSLYLVLYPNNSCTVPEPAIKYACYYTHSLQDVAEAVKKPGVEVYKMDGMMKVNGVRVEYKESLMEML